MRQGHARLLLLSVLQGGTVGTFDVLARCTGLPERQVRQTLKNLRHAGAIDVLHFTQHPNPKRARAVYAPVRERFDALRYAAQVWR